jgi:hypothetical protein
VNNRALVDSARSAQHTFANGGKARREVQVNGHHPTFSTNAPQCHRCGTTDAGHRLVDVYGAPLCEPCLRRLDADPRQKRRIMFTMSDDLYW